MRLVITTLATLIALHLGAQAQECGDNQLDITVIDHQRENAEVDGGCYSVRTFGTPQNPMFEFDRDWGLSGPAELWGLRGLVSSGGCGGKCDGVSADPPPLDEFGLRLTGRVYFEGGQYRFWAGADDGVVLDVDDRRLIDEWQQQSFDEFSAGPIGLSQGMHRIRLLYFEARGRARVKFGWQRVQ